MESVEWERQEDEADREVLVARVKGVRIVVYWSDEPGEEPGWVWRSTDIDREAVGDLLVWGDGRDGGPLSSVDEDDACAEALRAAGVV